jgi:hypothetical protein
VTTYVWFVRGDEHAAMCRTSVESVRKVDARADIRIMTDDPGREVMGATHFDSHSAPIMLANLDAQVEALLARRDDRDKFVFLDADVILLSEIPHVGDLTVTWRSHVYESDDGEKISGVAASMPYNYGVLACKWRKSSIEAFVWMRERIRKMHRNQQEWYGNQIALAELAGPCPVVGTAVENRKIPWLLHQPATDLIVGKIPCDRYNYTPKKAGEDVGGKFALHFKGKSRGLMKDYAAQLGLGWYL